MIHAHFIDFIQQDKRVVAAEFAQFLHNFAGQGTYVGTAVTAYFGFIMYATKRDAIEVASGRFSDRFTQRGLAHTWRANEANDRPFAVSVALLYGKVIEDAFFDVLKAVMIAIKNFFSAGNVVLTAAAF